MEALKVFCRDRCRGEATVERRDGRAEIEVSMEDPADVRRGIEALDRRCSIENIVVSMGGQGSLARIGSDLYRIRAPKVNVSNTVGCGDCLLAGLIRGFE